MADTSSAIDNLRISADDRAAGGRGRRRRRFPLWLLFLILLAGVGGTLGFLRKGKALEVETATVAARPQSVPTIVLDASGYVTARRQATVSSKVTGKVTEVMVEEGMKVEEGQILARLDDTNVSRQLALSQAQLASSRSNLTEIRVRISEAELNLKRSRRLVAESITDQAAADRDQASLDALKARLVSQEDEVAVAQRAVALRQQELEDLVIRAPFAGVAISKNAQPGEMISPISAGGGFTRTGITTVVDMASLEIEVDVNESYLPRVRPGQKVTAVLDSYPNWPVPGHVIITIPAADRQKATVKVRVAFDQLDPRILPDMGVKVSFLEDLPQPPPERLFVRRDTVTRDGKDEVAYRLEGDVAVKRLVKTVPGVREGDEIAIETAPEEKGPAITAGDRLIFNQPKGFEDGARVVVVDATTKAKG